MGWLVMPDPEILWADEERGLRVEIVSYGYEAKMRDRKSPEKWTLASGWAGAAAFELALLAAHARIRELEAQERTSQRQATLVERDGLMCEQHPGFEWPHDECAGPGMPWMLEGRESVGVVYDRIRELESEREATLHVLMESASRVKELEDLIRWRCCQICTTTLPPRHAPECLMSESGLEAKR